MSINLVKIRAQISIGNNFIVETPYIQSFNVRKSRGQLSTFDASLKVEYSKISGSNVGGSVKIQAGANGSMHTIYTGIMKKSTISPCWDDPGYVILNISGTDELSKLQGKKYTRRCRSTKSSWVAINSVTRKGLRDGKLDATHQVIETDPGDYSNSKGVIASPLMAGVSDVTSASAPVNCNVSVTQQPPEAIV